MDLYYIIFSLVFASCIFEFSKRNTKKCVLIIWCIFFTIFGGIRWKTGGDWYQYYEHFLYSSWDNIFNYDRYGDGREQLEPGFVFLNTLIKSVFGEFYIYNTILCAFIQYTYYKMCYKFTPNYPILMYAYLMINSSSYFPVRSWIALAIAYWGYIYIKEQNLKRYIIIVILATLIHNQCILFLPFYWVGRIRFNYLSFTLLYLILIVFSYLFQDYITMFALSMEGNIAEKLYHYTQFETEGKAGANYMSWALNYFLIIAYIYYRECVKLHKDTWINTLLVMSIAHSCIYIVFSGGMGDLTRLAILFLPAKAILFVICFTYFSKGKSFVLKSISTSFLIAFMIYRLTQLCSWYYFEDANVPYKTVFDYNLL